MPVKLSFLRLTASFLFNATLIAQTSSTGVLGYWREPGGSVIRVERCGAEVCATLKAISKAEPDSADGQNPDPALRTRSLCNLRLGEGFHLDSPTDAEGGHLYDPKSGKTYRGVMKSDGETLHLRGYVGFKAFGRTEDWTRTTAPAESCH